MAITESQGGGGGGYGFTPVYMDAAAPTWLRALCVIAFILSRLLMVYSVLIWIRIIMTWFVRNVRRGSLTWWLSRAVDPYLNLFRRRRLMVGMLDFSPIIAFAIIELLQSVLMFVAVYGRLTFGYFIYLFLQFFWSYCLSFFIILAGILLILRTIAVFVRNPNTKAMLTRISMAIDPFLNVIRGIFHWFTGPKEPNEKAVVITTLVITVGLFFALRYLIVYLASLALRIPF